MGVRDFPHGLVVKNLPCNTGDMGSIPGQGTRVPHAVEQPSPCTTTRESMHLNERSRKTSCGQINKYIFKSPFDKEGKEM